MASVPLNPMQQASQAQRGALAGTAVGMGYSPEQVTAGQLAGTNLDPYMNPYQQNVIGGLQTEANRAMQMGSNQLGAAASRAGAFGGSRHGIAEGQMMGDIQRGLNQQTGQLLESGYNQAQQAAQQDIARRMAAQQFNVQSGLTGAQQRLQAAAQLGALGGQSFGYGQQIQSGLAQQGATQQALMQALIDASKRQFASYTGYPAQSLGYMNQALGVAPNLVNTTGSASKDVGAMDVIGTGLQVASMFGFSDVRLKESIKKVGELTNGIGVYTWKWTKEAIKAGKSSNMLKGVLAQEVRKKVPDAVIVGDDGYMRVNYAHPELKGAI